MAQLEEWEARITEAKELFAKRLDLARQWHEWDVDKIRKDWEAMAEFRAEVMAEAIQSQDLCEQATAREEEVRRCEEELDRCDAELQDSEERAALQELEEATREEVLEHREAKVTEAEGALSVCEHATEELMEKYTEERVQVALLEFRTRLETQEQQGRERLIRYAEEAAGKRVEVLEAKVKSIDGARKKLILHAEALEKLVAVGISYGHR